MSGDEYYSIRSSNMDREWNGYPYHAYPLGNRRRRDRDFEQLSGSYDPHRRMSKSESSEPGTGRRRTIGDIAAEFSEMTSMQGLNYIHQSRKLWLRGFWILIVLSACGAMIFHLYYLCSVFFSYALQTKIELGFDSLTFPAITVCNINPIRASMLSESGPRMERLMQDTNTTNQINVLNRTEPNGESPPGGGQALQTPGGDETTPSSGGGQATHTGGGGETTPSPTSGGNQATLTAGRDRTQRSTTPSQTPTGRPDAKVRRKRYLDDLSVNYTNTYANYTDNLEGVNDRWQKEAKRTTESRIEEEFEALYSAMTRTKRIKVGHQLKDFMVQSSFSGRTISNSNFKVHQSITYGNCFTLQYSDFISRKSGPSEGLEMVLFLENDEYLRGWTNANGAHLVVHDQNTIPLIEQDGMAIAGGSETFIGIRRINIHRYGKPHSICEDGVSYWNNYNVSYTRQVCQDFCLERLIVEKCNCFDSRQDETVITFKLNENANACRENTEIQCVIQVERDYEFGKYASDCICPSPCKETKFERSISSRQWPSIEYGKVLVEAICARTSAQNCHKLRQYDGFQLAQNFIKLNIFYEDLNYENITEEPDYAEAQFLSDVGGTLGLWIGLSVISIFEICQFVVELMAACCHCNKEKDFRKQDLRPRNAQTAPERFSPTSNLKALSEHGSHTYNGPYSVERRRDY